MIIDITHCWKCSCNPTKWGCEYKFPKKADSDDLGDWNCKAPINVQVEVKAKVNRILNKND